MRCVEMIGQSQQLIGVRVSVTGADGPPQAEVSTEAGNLVLSVVPGVATAADTDEDAIQVVVTATRTEEEIQDVPRSVTVITREQIEEQSQLNTNISDILGQTVPGFGSPTFRNSDRLRPRGRDIQVLIDGVPVTSNNRVGSAAFRSISPSAYSPHFGLMATFGDPNTTQRDT